ncbi:MAG TPA: helix-hairpin-helix domain-containing protein, partial [Chitinophagaceae bacterium]|nr:helix-hairpin-helix domain-containing protein [Chitinophagaceae bacterium]
MNNEAIADQLSMLSKLMDIHGDEPSKAKTYASAAFSIEKLPQKLSLLAPAKLFGLKGIGEGIGKDIIELREQGELKVLKEYIAKTPTGVLEMMNIKGIGPKKINVLWKELEIETLEDLEQACIENIVAAKKGFGEKTQQKIIDSIQFQKRAKGSYLYAQVHPFADTFTIKLQAEFKKYEVEITGAFKRQLEVIHKLEWVTTAPVDKLKAFLENNSFSIVSETCGELVADADNTIQLYFFIVRDEDFADTLVRTSSSEEFYASFQALKKKPVEVHNEEDLFKAAGVTFIPSFLRERPSIIDLAKEAGAFSNLIQTNEIKGLIHAHSDWSDGSNTLEEMARELIRLGFEYLVISDHSKAAYYASGLYENKIIDQHKYIDKLNKELAPFKIFKSIECDILGDGSLDYDAQTLESFDLVITSIHSNLDMDEEKAMKRLLGAISNPYTTILGHMTGRR